jgi:ankyrin repeat protein
MVTILKVVLLFFVVLLQHGAEPTIRNTDGRTALDLADPSAKAVLTGKSVCSSVIAGGMTIPEGLGRQKPPSCN